MCDISNAYVSEELQSEKLMDEDAKNYGWSWIEFLRI